MKKIIAFVLSLVMLVSLCSCGKYVSSYSAIGLVKSNTSHSCRVSFLSLEGTMVFKLKKSEIGSEGSISYSVSAEEGEIYLYYDIYGVKEELAHVKAGESITDVSGYVEGGHTVYVIIEATGRAHGKVSVELDNAASPEN